MRCNSVSFGGAFIVSDRLFQIMAGISPNEARGLKTENPSAQFAAYTRGLTRSSRMDELPLIRTINRMHVLLTEQDQWPLSQSMAPPRRVLPSASLDAIALQNLTAAANEGRLHVLA